MSLNSLLMMTVLVSGAPGASTTLSSFQLKATQAITRAYFEGDTLRVTQMVAPIAARMHEKPRAAFDNELARLGVPTIDQLLVDARVKHVDMNLTKLLHKPLPRERIKTLKELHARIETILETAKADPILSGKLEKPKSLKEFEDVLWKAHVLRNRLTTSAKYISYSNEMAGGISSSQRRRLDAADRALVNVTADLKISVKDMQDRLDETAMLIRLERLRAGTQILRKPELTKERFQAAFTTSLDAEEWTQFQKDIESATRRKPQKTKLAQRDFIKSVTNEIEESQKLAGDLATKSRQFHAALHWWFRGRYGAGPEIAGLAKSPSAVRNVQLMMALDMPAEPPTPRVASGDLNKDVPRYDRRHHYTWAWENRQVNVQLKKTYTTGRMQLDRFY